MLKNKLYVGIIIGLLFGICFSVPLMKADIIVGFNHWNRDTVDGILYTTTDGDKVQINNSLSLDNNSLDWADLSSYAGDNISWDAVDQEFDVSADGTSKWNDIGGITLFTKTNGISVQLNNTLTTLDNITMEGNRTINATGNLTVGNDGDIILCLNILRDMYPYTDLRVNLGTPTNRFNNLSLGGNATFNGTTAGNFLLWDQSIDAFVVTNDRANLSIVEEMFHLRVRMDDTSPSTRAADFTLMADSTNADIASGIAGAFNAHLFLIGTNDFTATVLGGNRVARNNVQLQGTGTASLAGVLTTKTAIQNNQAGTITEAYNINIETMDAEDGTITTGKGLRFSNPAVDDGVFGEYSHIWIDMGADETGGTGNTQYGINFFGKSLSDWLNNTDIYSDGALTIEAATNITLDSNVSVSENLTISILNLPEISAPTTPSSDILRLYVEDIKGFSFFKYLDSTGMKRQLIRDSMILVKNICGSTIAANRIVYATGSEDNVSTVDLANASSMNTMPAIGVTIEAIANNTYGRVMQVGLLENINTNALTEGDVLYVSDTVAGTPITTQPLSPSLTQEIGTVLVKSATEGAIQIISRALTGDEFGTINNFTVQRNLTVVGDTSIAARLNVTELVLPITPPTINYNGSVWFNGTTGEIGIYSTHINGWYWK